MPIPLAISRSVVGSGTGVELIAVIEECGVLLKEVYRGMATAEKLLSKQQRPGPLLGGA